MEPVENSIATSRSAGTERCAYHPNVASIGTCTRCGSFYCDACFKELSGRRVCSGCLAIPGVDYLNETRARFWGKRDGWVWYFGLFGGLNAVFAIINGLSSGTWLDATSGSIALALNLGYFLLKPWARLALLAWAPVSIAIAAQSLRTALHAEPPHPALGPIPGGGVLPMTVLTLFLLGLAFKSTRNKLAFRIEASDAKLAELHASLNNPLATRAFTYGVASLFVPGLGLVSAVMAIMALTRKRAAAWPPVDGRARAFRGLVFSVLSIVIWSTVATDVLGK